MFKTTCTAENRQLTEKQIAALKYLIAQSKDASFFCKRLCFWLIEKSNNLIQPICVNLRVEPLAQESGYGIHNMVSSIGTTHLNEIMKAMGTDFHFSFHSGCYSVNGEERINTGYRVWLSPTYYDYSATRLEADYAEISAISLVNENNENSPEPDK